MWDIREEPGTGAGTDKLLSKGPIMMMVIIIIIIIDSSLKCETEEFQKQKLNEK